MIQDLVNRESQLATGLSSWWKVLPPLDGGKFWYDVIGTRHGTLAQQSWQGSTRPGGQGNVLFGNSVSNNVLLPADFTTPSKFSLAGWFYYTAISTDALFFADDSFTGYFGLHDSGSIRTLNFNSISGTVGSSDCAAVANTWYHFGISVSGSNGTFYFNGVPKGTTTFANTITIGNLCGKGNGAALTYLQGGADDFMYYTRNLSGDEFADLYNETRTGCPNLLKSLQRTVHFVLRDPLTLNASNSLSLSHSLLTNYPDGIVNNTLTLTHSVSNSKEANRNLLNSLPLTQSVTHNLKFGAVSSTLAITDAETNSFKFQSLSSSLGITQSIIVISDRVPASNTISLTDSAAGLDLTLQALAHTLSLTDSTFGQTNNQHLSHNLATTDLVRTSIRSFSFTHTLTITDDLEYSPKTTYIEALVNSLTMSDFVLTLSDMRASNDIQLTQSMSAQGPIYASVTDDLFVGHAVSSAGSAYSVTITDSLTITQDVRRVLTTQSLAHSLFLTHSVVRSYGLAHAIGITDSLAWTLSKGLAHSLLLTDAVVGNSIRYFVLSHSLTIGQSAVPLLGQPDLCRYSPTISIPGFPTVPTTSKQSQIVLTYPYVSPVTTLILRTPDRDNQERFSFNRVIRESRGGTQRIYRNATWPKNKRLTYQVSFNKHAGVEDFLSFVEASLGKEVGLLDYLNRQWRGILVLGENQFNGASRANRQLEFEFEGVLA